jgi:superfamily II DNA or RNA helicase
MMSGRNKDARNALKARQKMGQISSNSKNKFIALSKLLQEHRSKKILIFSQSTETVERIGFDFMIPFLTYETDTAERKEILRKFKDGSYSKLVASSVLDEGIDVPDASIGIILTGTSQPRQFIQRLGRILRPYFDEETEQMKQAIMYEIVCKGTAEVSQSRKRKENISKKRGE